ncbi:hypothetical protein GCM10023185_11140 [Hymenobacter saemangeumensis]|uniref:Apolipoprotein N-acyltransferase n=1 Tax=Hymenobacter saemangeumensis TaxID=1084522 RepID=A0ABP8I5Q9_9BACT
MKLHNPWFLLLLICLLASLAQLLLPWWSLAVVAFALGFLLARSGKAAFWAAFAGGGLSWLLPALWLNLRNDGLLASRMAGLLPLGGSAALMVVVTGLVAGLVAGLAALAGQRLRAALRGNAAGETLGQHPAVK